MTPSPGREHRSKTPEFRAARDVAKGRAWMDTVLDRTDRPGTRRAGDLERRPRRGLLVLALLAAAIFGVLAYSLFARSLVYYKTPTEVAALPGSPVRMSGDVVSGSIVLDASSGTVRFDVSDGRTTIPVLFEGAAPDSLVDGAEAVAEGSLGTDGVFRADALFAKCPSKFESKETAG